jgi:hypothetical protein
MTKRHPDKTLQRLIRVAEKRIAHKRKVLARHEPGTAYHTRASREIAGLEARIKDWKSQIGT